MISTQKKFVNIAGTISFVIFNYILVNLVRDFFCEQAQDEFAEEHNIELEN